MALCLGLYQTIKIDTNCLAIEIKKYPEGSCDFRACLPLVCGSHFIVPPLDLLYFFLKKYGMLLKEYRPYFIQDFKKSDASFTYLQL